MQINPQNNQSAEEQRAVNDLVAAMLARRDDAGARRRLAGLTNRPAAVPSHPAQGAHSVNSMQSDHPRYDPDLEQLATIMWNDHVFKSHHIPQMQYWNDAGFGGLQAMRDAWERQWLPQAQRDAAIAQALINS